MADAEDVLDKAMMSVTSVKTPPVSLSVRVRRRFWNLFASLLAPGYGKCARCKTPWRFTQGKETPYLWVSSYRFGIWWKRACFPLCVDCWSALTPHTRLPYYLDLLDSWGANDPETDVAVIRAVLVEGF